MHKIINIAAALLLMQVLLIAQKSPHGEKFNIKCSTCHTTKSWKVDLQKIKFDHSKTKFNLVGQHKTLQCGLCHKQLKFSGTLTECADCHKDIHQNSVGFDCASCHTPQTWLVSNILEMHEKTRFPLSGIHQTIDCYQCHATESLLNFKPLGVDCYQCHEQQYLATQSPNHTQANFSKECEQCHSITASSWGTSNIVHDFFPLTGGHSIANCFACHNQQSFSGLTQDCYTCHKSNFEATTNPNHVDLQLSTDCTLCHTTSPGWTPADFVTHDNIYALTGKHADIKSDCLKCHSTGFKNTPTDCYSCHQNFYDATTDPSHTGAGFGTDCETCHTTSGWIPATFDHDVQFFPVYSGKHAGAWTKCSDCHTNSSNFAVFSCYTCHEHNQTDTDSQHSGVNGYAYESVACFTCHPQGTSDDAINHINTGFALVFSHTAVECASCHTNGYTNTSPECISCHQDKYNSAPEHVSQSYPTACEQCHDADLWSDVTFDHSATNFPLTGAHTNSDCSKCHSSGYVGTSTLCVTCHQSTYDTAPEHVAQNYPTTCEQCHNTTAWDQVTFDHNATNFPLTGAHTNSDCSNCHSSGYAGTSTLCITCHQSKFDTAPEHVAQNYPTTCEQCHNTTAWDQVTFDHNATNFPLTGAHTSLDCSKCHASGYAGTSLLCNDCHSANYAGTTNPSHQTLGLSTTCETCHTTTAGWKPAQFPDHNSYYQLLGAHANIANDCANCHSGNYNTTPTLCYDCHQSSYNNSVNPPHSSAQFPTDCETCHTQSAWVPSTFDHDGQYFPIYSGKHNGEWNVCSDCHTNASDYAVFSCFTCHEHNQTDTNSEHSGVSGYTYDSAACYDCHPTGNGDSGGKNIKFQKRRR